MKERYERFCANLERAVGVEGVLSDEAMLSAADATFSPPYFCGEARWRELALAKARKLLKRGDIQERLSQFFEAADFDAVEAAALHVKHIRGEIEKDVVLKDGTVTTVRKEPSLTALLAYERMTLPQPASRSENVHVHAQARPAGEREGPPPMAPRVLSARVEE